MAQPDIEKILAPNPGPMTLEGTNSYLVGRDPATLIDPGPDDPGHIERLLTAAEARGGLGAVLVTHMHGDHSDGLALLDTEVSRPDDGESVGGLTALATPGHSADHLTFVLNADHPAAAPGAIGPVCFVGDLLAGTGSTFVPPRAQDGSLGDYLASLRLILYLRPALLCPGHGPEVTDPKARLNEVIEHRLMRERRLLAALERGERSRSKLLDEVWDDAPANLRPVAEITMQAHLEKLEDDGVLPDELTD